MEDRDKNIRESLIKTLDKIHKPRISDTKHIGIVKFFDKKKGFGFIASNNCGIDSPIYEQDFYVDDASFSEEKVKSEGYWVVFQWERQSRGRIRAINVRGFDFKVDGDRDLLLSYFDTHEVFIKKDCRINVFDKLTCRRTTLLPLLRNTIVNAPNRSVKTTMDRLNRFMGRYKIDLLEGKRYVFSKDYGNELRTLWEELFAALTKEEFFSFVNAYPPAIIYMTDSGLIHEWITQLSINIDSQITLKDLLYAKGHVAEEFKEELVQTIESRIEKQIQDILATASSQIFLEAPSRNWLVRSKFSTALEEKVAALYPYITRRYEDEIRLVKNQVRRNRYRKLLSEYESSLVNTKLLELLSAFNEMDENEEPKEELLSLLDSEIEKRVESGYHDKAIEILEKISKIGFSTLDCYARKCLLKIKDVNDSNIESAIKYAKKVQPCAPEVVKEYLNELFPLVGKYLYQSLENVLNKEDYLFESTFEALFDRLTSLFTNEQTEKICEGYEEKILNCDSISVLQFAANHSPSGCSHTWINKEAATTRIHELISGWDCLKIKRFVNGHNSVSDIAENVKIELITRAFDIISNQDFNIPFINGDDLKDSSPDEIHRGNLEFLKTIHRFSSLDIFKKVWHNYISNQSDEIVALFYYNSLCDGIPEICVNYVTNEILTSSFEFHCLTDKPAKYLPKNNYRKLFLDTSIDTFTPIVNILINIDVTKDNINRVIWMSELLAADKPQADDYYELKSWQHEFDKKFFTLQTQLVNNPKLGVILWALYFKTTANRKALSEIFNWLPIELQNKIVRRLFLYILQKKVDFSARTLYDFLTSTGNKLSVPLEILFSYLIAREKDSLAFFNDANMLTILLNRKDHHSWVGIKEFLTPCSGRGYMQYPDENSTWETDYYNGEITFNPKENKTILIIPYKMIDAYGNIQIYNNKYQYILKEIVETNFSSDTYQVERIVIGLQYVFNGDVSKELSMAGWGYKVHNPYLPLNSHFSSKEDDCKFVCECRFAEGKLTRGDNVPFYWCDNKPCVRAYVRFKSPSEWERYTLLDFMRILRIPTDYTNKRGTTTKKGYYIQLSSYFQGFEKYYPHLKCRKCGELMSPANIGNFGSRAVTEFTCVNDNCSERGKTVYLNHCFNKPSCKGIVDSRDSKKCPNGQYVCPDCGGCCSTENFRQRISNLSITGGYISPWIEQFVTNGLGHWERFEYFCYKCGGRMTIAGGTAKCENCDISYHLHN